MKKNEHLPDNPLDSVFAGQKLDRSTERLAEATVLLDEPASPIWERALSTAVAASGDRRIRAHVSATRTSSVSRRAAVSSDLTYGKNTYTYDAHTYHTKVPPQALAQLIKEYLPEGGLVYDPFGGSGMSGVAASVVGCDSIMNELSPAACFIASQFLGNCDPLRFAAGVEAVLEATKQDRLTSWTTTCRECQGKADLKYVVWAYDVRCPDCEHVFNIWDVSRQMGNTVREHKILSEFDCPQCGDLLKKRGLSRLQSRPVAVGYNCCGPRNRERTVDPDSKDLDLIAALDANPRTVDGYFPTAAIPKDGVNYGQPRRHGLDSVDKFYTSRSLGSLSQLWHAIHRIEDDEVALAVAWVFTSLYQRVTKLSEFRFWGGSGNLARMNVPFIANETNVYQTFERKARSIQDHLESTAKHYSAKSIVRLGSATEASDIPDQSVDLIVTDPPFGANINYSEVNFLWESWLGSFTNADNEAIMNTAQGKGVAEYQDLLHQSFLEAHRVLKPSGWMLVVFMNSSRAVWDALRSAIQDAGFEIEDANVLDKRHGTFKQFVSENAAGADLVLHCRRGEKNSADLVRSVPSQNAHESAREFIQTRARSFDEIEFMHVVRENELDARRIYSKWLSQRMIGGGETIGFPEFRKMLEELVPLKILAPGAIQQKV